ncbi:MAG: hypothetical protein ACLFPO_00100 [Spirochaetaceae bacterium]
MTALLRGFGILLAALLAAGIVTGVAGAQPADSEYPREPREDQYFDVDRYGDEWMTDDRNEDGMVDYAVRVTDELQKDREAVDFNYDGKMDDFYFYKNEVLQRQEIDTNYDGAIDLWVFLREGVYVERYERDTTYDGYPDVIKEYGQEQEEEDRDGRDRRPNARRR